jgi:hypothetical protein
MNSRYLVEKFADIKKLELLISRSKPHIVISEWAETAREINPKKIATIHMLRNTYAEMDEMEFKLDNTRILRYINSLLEALESDEDQRMLITTQALGARK